MDREIEDIDALIDHAGGSAFLYGHSSGATLAMHAAVRLSGRIGRIAMYDAPHNDAPDAEESWTEYLKELRRTLADGRRGDAIELFMRFVGTPGDQVGAMRREPFWPSMEAIAPTLAYDHATIIGDRWSAPTDLAAQLAVPALVIAGDASFAFMPGAAKTLSRAMPHGQLRILKDQAHNVDPGVLAPVLTDFFAG